jgi:hypothetical protein
MQTTMRKTKGCTLALTAQGHAMGFAIAFASCVDVSPANAGVVKTS